MLCKYFYYTTCDYTSIFSLYYLYLLYVNKYDQIQTSVGIGKKVLGGKTKKESTFRSRSLLFIAMGIYAAHKIGQNIPLIIPENGTIALNIPLMPSRRSACSTRTTHPAFMHRLQDIFTTIGISNPMFNPYELKSKGEMVAESGNQVVLRQLIDASCSCAKRGRMQHWNRRASHIKHCGMCLPCLYRRVSLHMNALDENAHLHYGTDVFNGEEFNLDNMKLKSPRDFRTLLEFIRRKPSIDRIEKELLINGMHDASTIRAYAHVVDRTINQIIDWINASGNEEIKRKAGIL